MPPGSSTSRRGALGEGVGRHDRARRSRRPVGAQLAGRAAEAAHDLVAVERHADHAGRGHRHLARVDARAIAAAPCILIAVVEPAAAGRALALPELATTTRSASSRARSWQTSTGAASTPERVKRAALVVSGASLTSSPRSGAPEA